MPEAHDLAADGPLTPEQQVRIWRLGATELSRIDQALLAHCGAEWRKLARVVGGALIALQGEIPRVPDVFYAHRAARLVAAGLLEARGDLSRMRYCEVRLVGAAAKAEPNNAVERARDA